MAMGVYITYVQFFMFTFRGYSNVLSGIGFMPLTILRVAGAFLAAWLIPRLPAQITTTIGCICAIIINILIATTPRIRLTGL